MYSLPRDLSPEGMAHISITRKRLQPRGPGLRGYCGLQMGKTIECQRWFESLLRPKQVTFTEFWCESPQAQDHFPRGSALLPTHPSPPQSAGRLNPACVSGARMEFYQGSLELESLFAASRRRLQIKNAASVLRCRKPCLVPIHHAVTASPRTALLQAESGGGLSAQE